MPVRIEGYEPPRDYRMERLVVSPDPGVIEVNIHPSTNWKELVHNINTLYEQAFCHDWEQKNLCWMEGIPEPVAAIISPSVAQNLLIVLYCADPIC